MVGIGALQADKLAPPDGAVATIVTGRNVDMGVYTSIINGRTVTLGDYEIEGSRYVR